MKLVTPEIAWHNREPVLSVDIQVAAGKSGAVGPCLYRIATAGADSHLLIWQVGLQQQIETNETVEESTEGSSKGCCVRVEFVADLTRHQKAVNCVRFNNPSAHPDNEELLASGDDESVIMIWRRRRYEESDFYSDLVDANNAAGDESDNKENWICTKILRLHLDDVYDLAWSPHSKYLLSASVDNTAILWNLHKPGNKAPGTIFNQHKGFVQGVAFDPLSKYMATLSSDRKLRVFDVQTKRLVGGCCKAILPTVGGDTGRGSSEDNGGNGVGGGGSGMKIFHDDTLKSYFRRLCFSPDGSLLFAPSGLIPHSQITPSQHSLNATFVFLRDRFNQPVMYYPSLGNDEYTVAVRCCPSLFELRGGGGGGGILEAKYRMVVAVASKSCVTLYDTQTPAPFAYITGIHYTRITDLAWSTDGRVLMISSTDGFCSFVVFEEFELGLPYVSKSVSDV